MCKFNNHLFSFTVLLAVGLLVETVRSASLGDFLEELLDQAEPEPETPVDYDIVYDQRQNGTENYRLKIDGLVIAVPAEIDLDDDGPSSSSGAVGSDDLSFILSGLGVDSDNLTSDDLYAILSSIAAKKTVHKDDSLGGLTDKVPEKPIDGDDNVPHIAVLRSEPGKAKKVKVSGRKNFRVRLPALLRKFAQPRKLN